MSEALKVKFWGVRGSYPAPGEETVKYGGNTSCVEIRAGQRVLILDAGTGIIPLGRELARQGVTEIVLLLSHLHHDHTQGFPFFIPAYHPSVRLHIFGPGGTPNMLRRVLEQNQSFETFPVSLRDMASLKNIRSVHETQVIVWDETGVRLEDSTAHVGDEAVIIRIHKSYAHPGGVYVYRLSWRGRSVVYATDIEGYVGADRRLVQFVKETDMLIHDAQYSEEHYRGQLLGRPSTQGYGHSTVPMACEVAAISGAGQLVLFHHDPSYADATIAELEALAKAQFERTRAAHEGLEIVLSNRKKMTGLLQSRKPDSGDVQYANHD